MDVTGTLVNIWKETIIKKVLKMTRAKRINEIIPILQQKGDFKPSPLSPPPSPVP